MYGRISDTWIGSYAPQVASPGGAGSINLRLGFHTMRAVSIRGTTVFARGLLCI